MSHLNRATFLGLAGERMLTTQRPHAQMEYRFHSCSFNGSIARYRSKCNVTRE